MDVEQLSDLPPWEWPDDADKILLRVLLDTRAEEEKRILAADLAGDYTVMSNDVARVLLDIVCNDGEPADLRGDAAVSLGVALEHADIVGFDDPDDLLITSAMFTEIQDSLRRLFEDTSLPRDLRRFVLEASVHAPRPWHADAVKNAYADGDELWRLTAIFCMHYIRGFDKEILSCLEDKNSDIRYWAVCAAGNWALAEAWPYMAAVISSDNPDKPLLIAAIHATAAIRPEAASGILADLMDHEDEEISDAVMEALSLAGTLDAFEEDDA